MAMLNLGAFLLLAAQDPAAEELYRTIVAQIQNAPTIRVAFSSDATIKADGVERKVSVSGTLDVKSGNRARFEVFRKQNGKTAGFVAVSDGKQSRRLGLRWQKPFDTPPTLRGVLDATLCLTGLAHGALSSANFLGTWCEEGDHLTSKILFHVSDFRRGEIDGRAHTLSYRVRATFRATGEEAECRGDDIPASAATVTLWYDPITRLPLKRTVRATDRYGREAVFTERYEKFVLGAEIPDDRFLLPKE